MSVKQLKRFDHLDNFESNLFTCINYKDHLPSEKNFIQIAAFDPGVVNTGCRIERRKSDEDGKIIVETVFQKLLVSGSKKSDQHYFITMREHLFEISKELSECDYILVESQMRNNPQAIRMSQHIISTLLAIIYNSRALVIEILPTVKSKSFGIKGLKGKELKKKAVEISTKLLEDRGDTEGLSLLKLKKKQDDMADVILYCDAWHRYLKDQSFVPPN